MFIILSALAEWVITEQLMCVLCSSVWHLLIYVQYPNERYSQK